MGVKNDVSVSALGVKKTKHQHFRKTDILFIFT